MKNSKKNVSQTDIFNFLKINAGQKYTVAALQQEFKIGYGQLRIWLNDLLMKDLISTVTNHNKYYLVHTMNDLSPHMNFVIQRPFKPLVLPPGFGERRKELYPEGFCLSSAGGKS